MPVSLTFYAACAVVVARFPSSCGSFLFRNNLRIAMGFRYNDGFTCAVGFNVVFFMGCYLVVLAEMTYWLIVLHVHLCAKRTQLFVFQ